jgi:hypothetical protein
MLSVQLQRHGNNPRTQLLVRAPKLSLLLPSRPWTTALIWATNLTRHRPAKPRRVLSTYGLYLRDVTDDI